MDGRACISEINALGRNRTLTEAAIHTDSGQNHYGGGQGPRWEDQLRGVHENGREYGCLYEHDFGYDNIAYSELFH